MDEEYPTVVAEAGSNHCGNMDIAKELIQTAAEFCKADCIKFQKRTPSELLSKEQYDAAHVNPAYSYGETYGAHREFLELTLDQHKQLKEWCGEYGIRYSCSVWDMTAAREIISAGCDYIKIPSASNTHLEMVRLICDEFGGQIHASLGMTTNGERDALLQVLEEKDRLSDTVVFHCISGYPVPFENCHIGEVAVLRDKLGSSVAGIGFSGHHLGFAIDNAAYALGARWFERHFTLDRTWKGTDHPASLEPDGLRRLARDLRATAKALLPKPMEILAIEETQRKRLKWKPR